MAADTLPDVRFDWPAGFVAVPVDGDAADQHHQVDRIVSTVFTGAAGPEVLAAAHDRYDELGRLRTIEGVAAAAVHNGHSGDHRLGAYLSIALTPLAYESADDAAEQILAAVAGDDAGTQVATAELPAGPAVVTTEVRTLVAPTLAATGEPATRDVGVLQVRVPARGFQCLLLVTLVTPALDEFDRYCADGAALARSVRFVRAG